MHTAVLDFHSGIHTAELDSLVGSTPRSLTPQWDGHREAQLHGGMHTTESSASNILFFRVNYVFQLRFASEVKKVPYKFLTYRIIFTLISSDIRV